MLTQSELDQKAAEVILYMWARGEIDTANAKSATEYCQFKIDFRQADLGAYVTAEYAPTGELVDLEV